MLLRLVGLLLTTVALLGCGEDSTPPIDMAPDVVEDIAEDLVSDVQDVSDDVRRDTLTPVDIGPAPDLPDIRLDIDPDAPRPASAPYDHVELLLETSLTLEAGRSELQNVVLPSDTGAVTLSVQGLEQEQYALSTWVGADGTALVQGGLSDLELAFCNQCLNRIAAFTGVFATLAPNAPGITLFPGPMSFVVRGFRVDPNNPGNTLDSSAEVRVRVHAKRLNPIPEHGVIDLNLYFTGAQGLRAESARRDPDFIALLETVASIYSQANIEVGQLTWQDIDPSFQIIESVAPGGDLDALFKTSAGQPNQAINVFFVDQIFAETDTTLGTIAGVSGGIPGAFNLRGTNQSGIAVALQPIEGNRSTPALTMAHELGHFLGLFHTTEANPPTAQDALPDTPAGDRSFLMFWTGEGTRLSPSQIQVMRSNPWIRHPEDP